VSGGGVVEDRVAEKVGRPAKFTPERQERILDAIRAGNYVETAALAAGIGKSTFYEWVERFPDFADAVQKARAEAETRYVAVIEKASTTSWQAAAWWLERSAPSRWGRQTHAHGRDDPVKPPPLPEGPRVRTAERLAALYKFALEEAHIKPLTETAPVSTSGS
jgi:hypothetical protein